MFHHVDISETAILTDKDLGISINVNGSTIFSGNNGVSMNLIIEPSVFKSIKSPFHMGFDGPREGMFLNSILGGGSLWFASPHVSQGSLIFVPTSSDSCR